jgi:methionyl-tRNA formyltransferase
MGALKRLRRGESRLERSTSISPAVRTVWVSFDVIGRDCLVAAAAAGLEVVGVVTLPGPVEPNRSGHCAFDDVARRLGAGLIETADVNAPETVAAVGALSPELTFVVGWSQLVREPFIAAAGGAVYGMHPTLLPRHRGRAPIPWAILTGLARTGVSLFEITDPTADSGPIVGQTAVPIGPDETATTLYESLAEAHLELIRTFVPRILAGTAPRTPQDLTRASSWPKRTPSDGIIDWETRAPYLYDWVRAQTRPYPGAFTWLDDARVVIWSAIPVQLDSPAPAGTIVERRPDGPVVACGEGGLLLREFEASRELEIGSVLG